MPSRQGDDSLTGDSWSDDIIHPSLLSRPVEAGSLLSREIDRVRPRDGMDVLKDHGFINIQNTQVHIRRIQQMISVFVLCLSLIM